MGGSDTVMGVSNIQSQTRDQGRESSPPDLGPLLCYSKAKLEVVEVEGTCF